MKKLRKVKQTLDVVNFHFYDQSINKLSEKVDSKTGRFGFKFFDNYTREFSKTINFKKFYKTFYKKLYDLEYVDQVSDIKSGEHADFVDMPDGKETRYRDMYECYYIIRDKGTDGKEYDIRWKCQKEISDNGVLLLTFDMISRRFVDNKEGLQEGSWELMIDAEYVNDFGEKLKETVLVRQFSWVANWVNLSYNYLYKEPVMRDLYECQDDIKLIWQFIEDVFM